MTRELVWPLRLGPDGDFATVEQGSLEEVLQAVRIIALTRPGDRTDNPLLGVDELVPAHDFDPAAWAAALERWEPRAAVDVIADGSRLQVTVALADEQERTP